MKSLFRSSATIVAAFLLGFLLLSAKSSVAETLLSQFQPQKQNPQIAKQEVPVGGPLDVSGKPLNPGTLPGEVNERADDASAPIAPATHYIATAYSLRGRTASGVNVSHGIIAADPRVLPLGSRVRLEAGAWSGEYLVADTGGAIRGRKIDIWTSSSREAMRFGRRKVKLTILSYGGRRSAKRRV